MEFWGIEVKPGQTVKCEPGDDRVLHLSQASLGESKKEKGSDNVPIFVNINSQKLVLGTLSAEKCAQIQYDLVFEKEFELSHGSKNTSVFFVGYRSIYQGYESEDDFSDSDSEADLLVPKKVNVLGKATAEKEASVKTENASAKLKAKAEIKDPIKDDKTKKVADKDDDNDDDDDDDDDSGEESDEDEDMVEVPGDNSSSEEDDDDDDNSEEEGTPKKVENATKRKVDSSKTPVPEKKAKLVTPVGNQKTGGKKVTHIATPHPAKQAGKPQQTPKSVGSVACKSCNRTFISENALQAHTKAKHGVAAK